MRVAGRGWDRAAKLMLVAALAVMAGCSDSTGPYPVDSVEDKPNLAVAELGLWIQDATLWVTPAVENPVNRVQLESSIKSLAAHLNANKTDDIKGDIARIREIINSGSMEELVAMGPIEVALNTIELAMGT